MKCGHLWVTKSRNAGSGMPGSNVSNVLLLMFLAVGAKRHFANYPSGYLEGIPQCMVMAVNSPEDVITT
jgi:hypothetical protein